MLAILGGAPACAVDWPLWPQLSDEGRRRVDAVLRSDRWSVSGRARGERSLERQFAEAFAEYCGSQYGVATDHGSSSLVLAIESLGLPAGAEVLVPAMTWVATATAVYEANLVPVIVDVTASSGCFDPTAAAARLTERTKALIAVHHYRSLCDMPAILDFARSAGLAVVEDCAQAHGAVLNGRRAGTFGDVAAFSMQQGKVLAAGEGGAVITDDADRYDRLVQLRSNGRRYVEDPGHDVMEIVDGRSVMGTNHCMTEMQAAILLSQLPLLDEQHAIRAKSCSVIGRRLEDLGLPPLGQPAGVEQESVYKYAFRWPIERRQGVRLEAIAAAISAEVGFAVYRADSPLNEHPLMRPWTRPRYQAIDSAGEFEGIRLSTPVARELAEQTLLFHHAPLLAPEHAARIADAIEKVATSLGELAANDGLIKAPDAD
ncbi:DegT/DnrJ/EryC1/StrS family aminotransferase [Streptomyces sp. NPDC088270]|uniref:DegT/DnrJ/EryC1/StrS family aminotransferase n=1 Tax=Streptomyces sp. NPDC088270 TaxID=3160990 RepID=UPI003445E2DC